MHAQKIGTELWRARLGAVRNSLSPPERGEGWGEGFKYWFAKPAPILKIGFEFKRATSPRPSPPTSLVEREKIALFNLLEFATRDRDAATACQPVSKTRSFVAAEVTRLKFI